MTSIKVVGLGAISGNGLSKESIFNAALNSQSPINEHGLCSIDDKSWQILAEQTPSSLRHSRCTQLSFGALTAALQEAKWTAKDLESCGFIFSSTTSQIDLWENELNNPEDLHSAIKNRSLGLPVESLREAFGMKGPSSLISSSCSSSLQALAAAFLWLRSDKVEKCIVGATEIQSELTRTGFSSLRLLSKAPCKPFDKARNGINLGEGSSFLLLENTDRKTSFDWGSLVGVGLSSDAFHPTSPQPEGIGSQAAMRMALESAALRPDQIQWIYAHGTGSAGNDLAEAKAIATTFLHRPWVTSTKSVHGHTLAASGALESVLGLMALKAKVVLGTTNCKQPDSQLELNIATNPVHEEIRFFLKNSLGFGGINASVIFSSEAAWP